MTTLYTNGCSYTANKWISDQERYPQLVANHFGWHLQDRSHPGSCNDRIIRTSMRDCIQLIKANQPIMALIQLTHASRTEYAPVSQTNTEWKQWNDTGFESIKPGEDLEPDVGTFMKHYTLMFDQQASMVKLLSAVIGLAAFFRQHSIQYRIYNGPPDLNQFEPEQFSSYLCQDPNVLDLDKFNMLALTGSDNHPDQDGMRSIADYFIKILS